MQMCNRFRGSAFFFIGSEDGQDARGFLTTRIKVWAFPKQAPNAFYACFTLLLVYNTTYVKKGIHIATVREQDVGESIWTSDEETGDETAA